MKIPRSVLSASTAAVLSVVMLTGCGGTASPSASQSAPPSADASASQSAAPSAGVSASQSAAPSASASTSQQPVTLEMAYWDYQISPNMVEAVQGFQNANPGVTVNVTDIPSSGQTYEDKLSVMLAGGQPLDVFGIKAGQDFGGYYTRKQLLNLSDYIKNDNIDMSVYGGLENLIKGDDGNYYAYPYRGDQWILFYNKDLFNKAGVTPPSNDMTWDDFRALAKKMTSGTGTDKIYGAYFHTWDNLPWILTLPGGGNLSTGPYDFMKPGYQIMLGMQNDDKSVMPYAEAKSTSASYRPLFESGKVAMVPMGTWLIQQMITELKAGKYTAFNWGTAKLPHMPGVTAGATVGSITNMAVGANSANKDLAWKLVKSMGSADTAKMFASKYAVMPAIQTPDIVKALTQAPGFPADAANGLGYASLVPDGPQGASGTAVNKIIDEEHQLIMTGSKSIDDGIAEMSQRVKEQLAAK